MNIKKLAVTLLLTVAFAILGQTDAQAAPLCTGSIQSIITGGGSCMDSSGLFQLMFTATTGSGRTTTDSDIFVTATGSSSSLDVVFAPDASVNNALSLTDSGSGPVTANYNFHYTISFASTLAMTSAVIDIANANVIPASNGSVNGFKLLNSTFEADTNSTDGTGGFSTLTGNVAVPMLNTPVTVLDSVSLHANTNGTTATVGSGSNNPGSVENVLSFTTVPEPFTFALCGMGLLGAGLLRRRNAK